MKHPQSVKLARYRLIAEQLRSAGNLPKPFAGNRWHEGLYLSYAADNVRQLFLAPLPNSATSMMEQLQNSRATVYLRWRPQDNPGDIPSMIDAFVPAAPWTLKSIIKNTESTLTVIEVYERAADRP